MPSSGGSISDAPVNKVVDGQEHQLSYITPGEAQNLVDQGGQPTMTNEGVMAYPPGMGDSNYSGNGGSTNQGPAGGATIGSGSPQSGSPVSQGPAGGASAGGDYCGNVNPQQEYAGHTYQQRKDYEADPIAYEEKHGEYKYQHKDLTFKEHWDNAPKAIRWSPTLRFLYSSGKNLSEWAKSKGWNWNSGTGKIYDNNNNEVGERHLMNTAAPDAPGLVSGQSNTQTTSGSYSASQWYANLGNTNTTGSNPFSFSTAFADAKAKQQTILGNPSAVRQLAVNESPFYNWLKENSLNKGIL